MPGWGWFLLGVALSAIILVVIWAVLRGRSGVDAKGLMESERKRLEKERDAERQAKEQIATIANNLEAELRSIAERKKKRLEALDAKKAKELRSLVDDPDTLLARVDAIVGQSTEDDTDPGSPPS